MSNDDYSQMSLLDMFRTEAEAQTQVLTASLLALEHDPDAAMHTEACMRAAHSLKGAARIVGVPAGVRVAHAMEDCFVAAQQGQLKLRHRQTDLLLRGVDLLSAIAATPDADMSEWETGKADQVAAFLAALTLALESGGESEEYAIVVAPQTNVVAPADTVPPETPSSKSVLTTGNDTDHVLRVTANNLNRLLGLAGESLVESRWLKPFSASLLRLKRMSQASDRTLENLSNLLLEQGASEQVLVVMADIRQRAIEHQQLLSQRLADLDMYDRRSVDLAHRLYTEALACRMRPFSDGTHAFPRMVRDLGRSLGKQVKLKISGESTQVDRDVLEKIDAPLGHLLRNAVDHGIESTEQRQAAGKPVEGTVYLEARHSSGLLQVIVMDDGAGIDLDRLRNTVVERNLTTAETAGNLSDAEVLEFLFLPGFSMKAGVTDISGRGVGLDVVKNMMKHLRGVVQISSEHGKGTRFQMQLPLTLSVLRTMLVNINGEPYAFPLALISRTLKVSRKQIEMLEGRQYIYIDERRIGLATAHQVLEVGEPDMTEQLCVVVVGEGHQAYGLIVDGFLGERELVVQPLDARLGKVKNIVAGALMEDGAPVLIVDVDDIIRSVDKLVSGGQLSKVQGTATGAGAAQRRRVLVVDDSLTVRELERKLLISRGYEVDIAVDGMDGWNAVRTNHYDLVITDIDMPRLDGFELVALIKQHPNFSALPVMVVSYKDREEDRRRGLEAGADYYLTKGSFHDETLLQAVVDLIGDAMV
jgi:two-component system sensor histidine kinase and response regulator WspE